MVSNSTAEKLEPCKCHLVIGGLQKKLNVQIQRNQALEQSHRSLEANYAAEKELNAQLQEIIARLERTQALTDQAIVRERL